MTSKDFDLSSAIAYAGKHARDGLSLRPYDPIYLHTLDQLAIIDQALADDDRLQTLTPGEIDVGRMAAKELGNEEADFAHALHIIQRAADAATGDNAENQ